MFNRLQNRRNRKFAGIPSFGGMSKEQMQMFNELEKANVFSIDLNDIRLFEKIVAKMMLKYAPGFDISTQVENILETHANQVNMLTRHTLIQISKLIHDSLEESIEVNTYKDPRNDWDERFR